MGATVGQLDGIKAGQQRMWASGNYVALGALIHPIAERLCETADLAAGSPVLDVATGSGNAAIAAARCGCDAVGIDYVPELLDRARARAEAEGLSVKFIEADAEALPFADASFDAVLSCVGVMFTPDHERAADELVRVCRPGGTIALANWSPDGFVGAMFRTVAAHVPPLPGVRPPGLWGTEEHLDQLLGRALARLKVSRREFVFRFCSTAEFVEVFRDYYGPVHKAFDALDENDRRQLYEDLIQLAIRHDREPGPSVAIPSAYVEAVAVRAS
jgi:ubiquinone/menaquinone biosynthesis C-methylase UbiE